MKTTSHNGIPSGYLQGIPCGSRDDSNRAPSGIPPATSDRGPKRYTTEDQGGIPSLARNDTLRGGTPKQTPFTAGNGIPIVHARYTSPSGMVGIPILQIWYTILISILIFCFIIGPIEAESYIFPRMDGAHFIFETDWENDFNRNQFDDDVVIGQHSFMVINLSLPVSIQFKRMALDSNNCYRNRSWHISVILSEGPQVIQELDIDDEHTNLIEIQPEITYNLAFIIQYDKETIQEGKHWVMIQLNVIADDINEPHYYFEIINYRRLKTQAQPFSPVIPLLLSTMGIVAVIYYLRKQRQQADIKEKE